MQSDSYRLEELLAHRWPMLLLDRVIEAGDKHAVAEVTITPESAFYQPPFGVPAWVGIEYMAQSIGVLTGAQAQRKKDPTPMGYLLGTRKYNCTIPWFKNGDTLTVSCEEELFDSNGLGAYNCSITRDEIVSNCRLTVYQKPDEQIADGSI